MSSCDARQVFLAVSLQRSITHLALCLRLPNFLPSGTVYVLCFFGSPLNMDNKCTHLSQYSSNLHSNVYYSLFNLSTCVYLDDRDYMGH